MANQACSRCGGKNGNHQEWCPFNPKHWEPALVVAGALTPPTVGGYATAMTNTSGTQASTSIYVPANAVTEQQAFQMLGNAGISDDLIAGAFYRMRSRARTVLAADTWSYRFEKLAADIFVVAAVPTASIR